MGESGLLVLTIGHSTRPIGLFLDLLESHHIEQIADVRTIPRSRHNPQYGIEVLPGTLASRGIEYVHLPGLGGLRRPRRDSPNLGWRNASFRGFADYMGDPRFDEEIAVLIERAGEKPTALLCAEAVPWRCHRSLIADALVARGVRVEHILGPGRREAHSLTPFARVEGTRITYPPTSPEPCGGDPTVPEGSG